MKRELTEKQVIAALRKAVKEAGSQYAFARKHGLQRSHVSEMLTGARPPQAPICAALGIERAIKFFSKDSRRLVADCSDGR